MYLDLCKLNSVKNDFSGKNDFLAIFKYYIVNADLFV